MVDVVPSANQRQSVREEWEGEIATLRNYYDALKAAHSAEGRKKVIKGSGKRGKNKSVGAGRKDEKPAKKRQRDRSPNDDNASGRKVKWAC